jgi:hypothetical protein
MLSADSLGLPGQGLHTHVCGIAVLDVLGTVVAGQVIASLARVSPVWTTGSLFVLGELAHWYFGVNTTIIKLLHQFSTA